MTTQLLVGLTGGLASGKSTVARLLAEAGCRVVDADRLVAQLYRPGQAGAAAVAELFGSSYLDSTGAVDHQRLAGLVFADHRARRRLELAIHPLVAQLFIEFAQQDQSVDPDLPDRDLTYRDIVVIEGTLLVEAGYDSDLLDLIVTVETPAAIQLQRAIARGMTEEAAAARLEAQGGGESRRAAADYTIDNSGSLADLESSTRELLSVLKTTLEQVPDRTL